MLLDQAARDRRPGAIEFRRSVAGFAQQHHAPVGEAVEQLAERRIVEAGQAFGGARDHFRDGMPA